MVESLARSKIQVFNEKNEPVTQEIKAVVLEGAIRIFRPGIKIEPGYFIKHFLPFGEDTYNVVSAQYAEGLHGIPPSYALNVRNIKEVSSDKKNNRGSNPHVVHNTINLGSNGRVYQDSTDYSVNTHIQNYNEYSQILSQLKNQVGTLNLDPIDLAVTERAISTIENETKKEFPNKEMLKGLFLMLPTAVQTLAAAGELANMFTG